WRFISVLNYYNALYLNQRSVKLRMSRSARPRRGKWFEGRGNAETQRAPRSIFRGGRKGQSPYRFLRLPAVPGRGVPRRIDAPAGAGGGLYGNDDLSVLSAQDRHLARSLVGSFPGPVRR